VATALRPHKVLQAERLLAIGVRSEHVNRQRHREPWLRASFRPTGVDSLTLTAFGVTFDTLRHGAATLLLAAGVPDKVALEVMGTPIRGSLRRYQEVVDELKRDAASRVNELLG
jgi:integrase